MNSNVKKSPQIELIYDPDCPNIDRARSAIREALRTAGWPEVWKEWNRALSGTPDEFFAFGSPTVLVNGRDICSDEGDQVTGANSCRIYMDECGSICGAPSTALILSAFAFPTDQH